jgi:hypothetical protein
MSRDASFRRVLINVYRVVSRGQTRGNQCSVLLVLLAVRGPHGNPFGSGESGTKGGSRGAPIVPSGLSPFVSSCGRPGVRSFPRGNQAGPLNRAALSPPSGSLSDKGSIICKVLIGPFPVIFTTAELKLAANLEAGEALF